MPSSPATVCPCGGRKVNGRCDRCGPRKHNRTTKERGYDYAWQTFRAAYLADHPLCEDCMAQGLVRAAQELHHKVKIKHAQHLRLDRANVSGLCERCHDARTARGE